MVSLFCINCISNILLKYRLVFGQCYSRTSYSKLCVGLFKNVRLKKEQYFHTSIEFVYYLAFILPEFIDNETMLCRRNGLLVY